VIQRNTPREMRGRVNSVFFVSRDVLFLVGMGRRLADFMDVRLLYLIRRPAYSGRGSIGDGDAGLRQGGTSGERLSACSRLLRLFLH